MISLIGKNNHIAFSVERIAYSRNRSIFHSFLSATRYPLSAKDGFTLLELLVVVLIISITLGFLTPAFRKTFLDIQLNSSAQDIVSLSRYAQERAILENTAFRLNLDAENGSYWLTMKEQDKPEGDGAASDKPEGDGAASDSRSHSRSHKPEGNGLASHSQSHKPDQEAYSKLRGNFGRLYTLARELKMEARENTIDFYPDGEVGYLKIKITNPNNKGLVITQKSGAGGNIVVLDENDEE